MIGTIQEGRYRILRKIGEGGQGEVYLAEHIHLGRTEALKVLKDRLARDENFVSRFRREARATNRVQHPHIVGVYDFGRLDNGRYFLAMEYVDGERLDHTIGGAPMAVKRAIRIGAQIARGLHHAHSMGVVHRDLKPANIILTRQRGNPDFVKILDFGMAKILEKQPGESLGKSLDGQMFGTAPYMAPEQFLERGADPRMDIYATGCILVEMLTGRPPFHGGMATQMDHHLRVEPEAPSRCQPTSGIPDVLDQIVLRCLAKQADNRYAEAHHLAEALEALISSQTTAVVRRTKIGVAAPSADDFEEDTQQGATDPGAAPAEGSAMTELMTEDQQVEVAAAVLEEVADGLTDLGVADASVVAGAAQLRDLRRQINRMHDDALEIDSRMVAYEQSVREREASLTFALGELAFDRDRGDAATRADVAIQIDALEKSLAALGSESRQKLGALDEQALGLAASLHDLVEQWGAWARRVAPAIAASVDKVTDERAAASLRRQLATVRSLLGGQGGRGGW